MTEFWLALKLLFSKKTLGQTNSKVALAGIIIGVGCLVVAMAVMSGFESTLRETVVDVAGHLQVFRSAPGTPDWDDLEKKIFQMDDRLVEGVRFVFLEAVLAHKGDTVGITIQGLQEDKWKKVLNFTNRVVEGSLDISRHGDVPKVLIGKVLAERLNLHVGDHFRVVIPIADTLDPERFGRRLGEFEVSGILEFGKYEWNERFLIANLESTQELAKIGRDRINGIIFRTIDSSKARDVYFNLSSKLGFGYTVRDWQEYDQNLFQATGGERIVIFFVVFIIVIVAAFSVAANFYINIFQRYPDIAIFKTVGLTSKSLIKIYGIQGLLMGLVGTTAGYTFGLILSYLFVWGQRFFKLLPGSVYHLSEIQLQFRFWDSLAIFGSTLLICFVASIFPAYRGAKLNPVEGLRYE